MYSNKDVQQCKIIPMTTEIFASESLYYPESHLSHTEKKHCSSLVGFLWWSLTQQSVLQMTLCCVIKFNDDCSKSINFFSLNIFFL